MIKVITIIQPLPHFPKPYFFRFSCKYMFLCGIDNSNLSQPIMLLTGLAAVSLRNPSKTSELRHGIIFANSLTIRDFSSSFSIPLT